MWHVAFYNAAVMMIHVSLLFVLFSTTGGLKNSFPICDTCRECDSVHVLSVNVLFLNAAQLLFCWLSCFCCFEIQALASQLAYSLASA